MAKESVSKMKGKQIQSVAAAPVAESSAFMLPTKMEEMKNTVMENPVNDVMEKSIPQVSEKTTDDIELSTELVEKTFEDLNKLMQVFKLLLDKKLKKEITFDKYETVAQKINDALVGAETLTKFCLVLNKLSTKMKNKRTNKKVDSSEPRKLSGFTKPVEVPERFKGFFLNYIANASEPELKERFGKETSFNINDLHPRTTLTKIIFTYIRSKELYVENEENNGKKLIKLDKPLKELFEFKHNLLMLDDTNEMFIFE